MGYVLGILLLVNFAFLNRPGLPALKVSLEDSKALINYNTLKVFNFGLKRLISSVSWVNTLLDGDIEHISADKKNSWMFYRFNLISELEPLFRDNYFVGGRYLSIIKDDVYGAEIIYDKGIKQFPNDFWLIYNAAFNQYSEIRNYKKAIELYKRILNDARVQKSIPFLPSLVARIEASSSGDLVSSFNLLYTAYVGMPDDLIKKRAKESLYSIKAEIDLDCLNLKRINCKTEDFYGNKYILSNGRYTSLYKYEKFKLYNRNKTKRD